MLENAQPKKTSIENMPPYVGSDLQKEIIEKQKNALEQNNEDNSAEGSDIENEQQALKDKLNTDTEQVMKNLKKRNYLENLKKMDLAEAKIIKDRESRRKLGLESSFDEKVSFVNSEIEDEKNQLIPIAESGVADVQQDAKKSIESADKQQSDIESRRVEKVRDRIQYLQGKLTEDISPEEKIAIEKELATTEGRLVALKKPQIESDPIEDNAPKQVLKLEENSGASPNMKDVNELDSLMGGLAAKAKAEQEAKGIEKQDKKEKTSADALPEVQSILKSIAHLKKDPFASPSMIARERSKMRDLIKSGKIDSLEAEILMQDSKKHAKNESLLGKMAGRVAEKNRKWKKNSWIYRNLVSIPDYDKKWKTWTHRLAKTVVIGTAAGAAGIGVAAALGVGAIGGAGIAAARLVGSTAIGGVAGKIHEQATKKTVAKDNARYKGMLDSGYSETRKSLGENNIRLTGEEFQQLRSLRKEKELSLEQKTLRDSLEAKYAKYEQTRNQQYDRSRDNYQELVDRRRGKNEKNRSYVTGAAAFLAGLGSAYALPYLNPDSIPTPVSPDNPNYIPTPKPTLESGDIFINKGEGITNAYLRQLENSSELREYFGIEGKPTGADAFKAAQELGYIDADGEVRVKFDRGAGYKLELVDESRLDAQGNMITEKKLISREYFGGSVDENGNYVGGTEHEVKRADLVSGLEKDIEGSSTSQDYEYKTARGELEVNTTEEDFDTDFIIKEKVSANTLDMADVNIESDAVIADDTLVLDNDSVITETPNYDSGSTQAELELEREKLRLAQERFEAEQLRIAEEQRAAYEQKIAQQKELLEPKKKSWFGRNWGWLAGAAVVAADVIEDGKLDAFGALGKGAKDVIEETTTPGGGWDINPSSFNNRTY